MPQLDDEETISTQVLQQLSRTPYACSSLSQLGSRETNFVYRGVLDRPFSTPDGATARSIIIKHSTESDITCRIFEESLLNSIAEFPLLSTATTVIKTPRVYLFDRESNTLVLEDFINTDGFKSVLLSPNTKDILPPLCLPTIGHNLGSWLRSFHTWALAPDQAALRAQIWQNDPMRKTKFLYTYDGFVKVLENFPELLEGHKQTLETVRDAVAKEFEKSSTEEEEGWGLIHADLWSGNILLPRTPWRESPLSNQANQMFIIDWEFAQFGHRSYDLGQIVGDLLERKIYNNAENVITVMEGVINGYGDLTDEMAFRTAIYVGVHLISYDNRRPRKGPRVAPPEVITAGFTVGRDFIIKGWEKDRKFFEASALASLFTTK